jgi:hypothetical protein
MPTLFDETWQDNAGDTVSASDLNSHAGEHSNALVDVEEGGTVIGGIGRDQPINVTGSGASVSKSNGEIVVDVTDTNTDTRVETQAGGTQQYADTSTIDFDTSSDISVTDNGSGKITVAASGGGGSVSDSGNVLGGTAQNDDRSISIGQPSTANADLCVVAGTSTAGGNGDVTLGSNADSSNSDGNSITIGTSTNTSGARCVNIGRSSSASGFGAISIGNYNSVSSGFTVGIGNNASLNDFNQIHITTAGGSVSGQDAAAIGSRSSTGMSVSTSNVIRLGGKQLAMPAFKGGTIANTDLNNQEFTVQANSAEDALTFRYKTSGGTVKTGTVNIS